MQDTSLNLDSRKAHNGFTIVEIMTTVVLLAVFVGIFVNGIAAYQNIRYDSTRRADAYAIAKQLAYLHRSIAVEGTDCNTSGRQLVSENQNISNDEGTPGSVRGDITHLVNPRYSVYVQYLNGCDGTMRIIVAVHYGPAEKRDSVESVGV